MNLRYLPLLLLATGACQRASYVFLPPAAAVTCTLATGPPALLASGRQPVLARVATRAVLHRWRRPVAVAQASRVVALPEACAQVPEPDAPRHHTPPRRRQPAMSEDAKFFGLIIGAVVLLLAGGLWLIVGVGGGLAVVGGVVLLLLALLGVVFGLFAAGFKGRP